VTVVDAFRLAFGTLTVIPVRAPRGVDSTTARNAMLLAPVVGLVLGVGSELVAVTARWAIPGHSDRPLVAVLAIVILAALTRAIHLDGLADTADAFGSGRRAQDALAVMRRSDIGPFGVVTLVLVLLLQVAALYTALLVGRGTLALVGGAVVSRLAITWSCRRGVRSARDEGLGAAVANSVPLIAVLVATVVTACVLVAGVWWDDDTPWRFVVNALLALAAALAASQWLVRKSVQRFGGVTGDVIGAACEVAFLVFVLAVSLG
jgi:adenosylcobinamide-GDP ribazoletransferase